MTDHFWIARLLALPHPIKRTLAVAVDIALCVVTTWLALCLRLEEWVVIQKSHGWAMTIAVCLALPLFVRFGLYRAIFRYAGWNVMFGLAQSMGWYGLLYGIVFTAIGVSGVPRAVGMIQPLLLAMGVGLSRMAVRYWLGDSYRCVLTDQHLPRVLVYGAGDAGRQLASALNHTREQCLLGFLDDDRRLHHRTIDGLPIYPPDNLAELIPRLGVTDVLLAMPSVSRARRSAILNGLQNYPVHVRTLPGLADLVSGRVTLNDVREPDIEDLLGREPVIPNGILLNRNLRGKVVLVTGAGGSIGGELCRQIVQCAPERLLLVENSESALYQIHRELQSGFDAACAEGDRPMHPLPRRYPVAFVPLLASVQDKARMSEIMRVWRPHTVYHAAAYKHVPLVERNAVEGVRNNVWGTEVCAQAAAQNGVESFVFISTDKAVHPTSIMGASKRVAEMVLQSLAKLNPAMLATVEGGAADGQSPGVRTCFSMVRFGNVLGSSGSVVPLFREQIKKGGPITLTHAEITRYFMTIPEAAQLVIQAGAMATGGDVFVLDMGQPVRIYDLACRMVHLSGLSVKDAQHPDGDIEIEITGLRPGEKLYEELLIGDMPRPTQHPRIMKAHEECPSWTFLNDKLDALQRALTENNVPRIKAVLQQMVCGYRPTSDVVDWVHLAQGREAIQVDEEVLPDEEQMPRRIRP